MAERHLSDGGIFLEDSCVICKLGFHNEKPVKVTEKGMLSLISYSEKRGKPELHTYLTECVSKTPIGTVLVHQNLIGNGMLIHRVCVWYRDLVLSLALEYT